ncbi:MAG: Bug family tripartite tricarboxylate transporter substrate binding protein [Gammaproteobacteria bacterium]
MTSGPCWRPGRPGLTSLIKFIMIIALRSPRRGRILEGVPMRSLARTLHAFCLSLLCVALPGTLHAQAYPTKVVHIIVPYPPGGVVDITGRLLADQLGKVLGSNVVVENKPGAAGMIGSAAVARAPADGHTVLFSGAATHAFAPALYKEMQYDPVKDFIPVTQLVEGPLALCVNASSPVKDLAGFVDMLKARGNAINYSANGNGTYPHLSVELLKQIIGVQPVHVTYKGGGQAITALLANEVQFSQNHIPIVLSHVKSGRLRVLATTGNARSSAFPDVPTLKEAGYDVVASAWFGLFVPAGTPRAVVARLHEATAAAAKVPSLRQRLAAQGDEVVVEGPEKFLAYQLAELEKWKGVIGRAGLKLQ